MFPATIQLASSRKIYLEGVAVSRDIPMAEMALGRKRVVVFFDEHNAKEAVVAVVYT